MSAVQIRGTFRFKETTMTAQKLQPVFGFAAVLLLAAACSSAPGRPVEIFTIQSMTETQLGLANSAADQANYTHALELLAQAWRLAVSTDRPALRIRVRLARGNTLYALGRNAEAESEWYAAQTEANFTGNAVLAAACRVYMARAKLLADADNQAVAQETLTQVQSDMGTLKRDNLLAALGWTVIGLAQKSLGSYTEAEKSVHNARAIHEDERYLAQAGYDWFLVASIRSTAGNYPGALGALNNALDLDRRAENTYALASDWQAIGDVFKKMNVIESSNEAYRRSGEIFRSISMNDRASQVESRVSTGGLILPGR
jgi:tetratricopeptide (TPR) repeat protein